MSKIGNKPIQIPADTKFNLDKDTITITGELGELKFKVPKILELKQKTDMLYIKAVNEEKKTKSIHGLFRQLIVNGIRGATTPWQKKLEVVGTGYNVKQQGEDIVFKLGYSHPIIFKKVPQIKFQVEGSSKVIVSGMDKQLVGQIAYQIRILKPPDAYKGKGIRYEGEKIKLKPGKKVKTLTTAAGS